METQIVGFPLDETERRIRHVISIMPALGRSLLSSQDSLNIRNSSSSQSDKILMEKADRTISHTIVRSLQTQFPEDKIVSEDEGQVGSDGDFEWWCDPVDGTRNFIHGIPFFCISMGLTWRGSPVGGVVHVPAMGQTGLTYHAIVGQGAFKNQNPIHVSTVSQLERAVMASGLPYRRKEIIGDILGDIFAFVTTGIGLRRTGSVILDLCWIAEGKFDALWDRDISPWDSCAASVILFEAGGKISGYLGEKFDIQQTRIVASNGILHEEAVSVLQKARKTTMN
ncbi:MAG TPA: inositol monophosphatase family protein [Leptospiraceae bacterium]|nr:inositol monophosphatase [Leptospirales bacterium]HMU82027.1 inositol monophosphatase family protein [Leptospiraceae bacterium]HMW59959.1 inositol monophosphatase family protein [Leptospiraceae bacterium]HMX55425.1 inositol monophosphatase family protein [Leptospiraceae bacterium]HMY45923.1 inositol monophosphatase family protein [Leptospiraceae bacterium]